jgi:hypothetical protein
MCLLIPLVYTGKMSFQPFSLTFHPYPGFQVRERHHTIHPAIRSFEEEAAAYSLISLLMWLLPLTVTMASLLDFSLLYLYNKKFHPWSAILAEENIKSDQNKESRVWFCSCLGSETDEFYLSKIQMNPHSEH